MPEGPQVRRAGDYIAGFAGTTITEIVHPKSRAAWPLELPTELSGVDVVGKNIFIRLGTGEVIYNHLLMWGSWFPGEVHPKGKRLNTRFITDRGSLNYFGGGIIKLISADDAETLKAKLGPDILQQSNAQEAFARVQASPLPVGVAVLDQSLVSGIGNIYKSEGLFIASIHPLRPASSILPAEYQRLFSFLQPQMRQDVERSGPISTTTREAQRAGNRNFVYRRQGQPCLLCFTTIHRIYQGSGRGRSTYFCPRCQPIASLVSR